MTKARGPGQLAVRFLALFAMLCYSVRPAGAADNVWQGLTDPNWDTDSNWSSLLKPAATDDAVFPNPIPTGSTIFLSSGELAQSLTFMTGGYDLAGGTLTLAPAGNITVAPAS